ncbi:MAG: hypothetical protein A3F11_03380 [Gammaproteobacteria bacterium RIFCSPHIGHO2_12_FULL_37_14]|nr:MAG: hypothetical protein A3F11_03380 [Gammaproteobacteria bacterium RIFCSPHIGHO2_12_FULL_37_14]
MYKATKKFIVIHRQSMVSFLIVGAISAVINFVSFAIFWQYFKISYSYAVSYAYVLSVIFHFAANRNMTFKHRGTRITSQIPKYLVMILINYLITLAIVDIAVQVMGLSPYIGIALSIGATVGVGYLMSRFWIFRAAIHS